MAWSSIVRVLLLALFAWELRLAASKDEPPAFMREQTKAKSNQFDRKNPGARQRGPPPGRGPPEGMPEPEVMDQHMEEMHDFFCAGAKKTENSLCRIWYENEDNRKAAVAEGKPPPPPKGDEEPDVKDIGMMHKEWCAVEGNEKKGPCLMWSGSPIKKKFEDEHDSL
jgi:hypothetical protein